MELILRSSGALQNTVFKKNKKQKIHTDLLISRVPSCTKILGFFLPGWGNSSSRNWTSCMPISSPMLTGYFLSFCPTSPKHSSLSRYCYFVTLVCSGQPAICMRPSKCLVQTGQGKKGHAYFHLAAEGFSCITPQAQSKLWRGCNGY